MASEFIIKIANIVLKCENCEDNEYEGDIIIQIGSNKLYSQHTYTVNLTELAYHLSDIKRVINNLETGEFGGYDLQLYRSTIIFTKMYNMMQIIPNDIPINHYADKVKINVPYDENIQNFISFFETLVYHIEKYN